MPTKTTAKPSKSTHPRSLKQISVGRRDVRKLKITDIEPLIIPGPDGKPVRFNVREDFEETAMRELVAQIRENGQKEPGRGYMQPNGKFGLTDGERRLRALTILAKEDRKYGFMEVCPESQGTTDTERNLDLLLCNSGQQLNMMEQGHLYARLRDGKMSVKQIHVRTGKTEQHIYDCLTLLGAPIDVKEAITAGKIAPSTVVTIAKKVPAAQVASTVKTSIAVATLAGKKKATNRHVPKSAGGGRTRRKPAAKNDLESAKDDLKAGEQQERMAVAAEYQADSVGRLQELLTATVPSKCIKDRRETVEWLIDYLKGDKTIAEAIDFLAGNEPLL